MHLLLSAQYAAHTTDTQSATAVVPAPFRTWNADRLEKHLDHLNTGSKMSSLLYSLTAGSQLASPYGKKITSTQLQANCQRQGNQDVYNGKLARQRKNAYVCVLPRGTTATETLPSSHWHGNIL